MRELILVREEVLLLGDSSKVSHLPVHDLCIDKAQIPPESLSMHVPLQIFFQIETI
jgi:hypothetical protein